MTLTKDQKRALLIVAGVAGAAILFWLFNRQTIVSPVGMDGPGDLIFNNQPPGYTSFNTTPANVPLAAQPVMPLNAGQGCCAADAVNDGCFTSDPLATGRGPLGMDQLLGWYAQQNPSWAAHWNANLQTYNA